MKKYIYTSFIVLLAMLHFSCEELPDLNPISNPGADIEVQNINQVLVSSNGSNFSVNPFTFPVNIGLINEPINFRFDCLILCGGFGEIYGGGILFGNTIFLKDIATSGDIDNPFGYIFPVNSLSSSYALGAFFDEESAGSYGGYFDISTQSYNSNFTQRSKYKIPNGTKYVMFKKIIAGDEYHGWIEFETNLNTSNFTGQSIVKRIAIAEQPGFVLRAGQTE
jgi:hypothetical protein